MVLLNPLVFSLALFGALERAQAFDKHVPFYKRIQKHAKPFDPIRSAKKEVKDLTAQKAPGWEISLAQERLDRTSVTHVHYHGGQRMGGAVSPRRKRQLARDARPLLLHTQAGRNPAPSGAI